MSAFDEALAITLKIEGPRSNLATDPGGDTVYGIAKNRHPEMWASGPPSYEQAVEFYRRELWDPLSLDGVAALSKPIALELFDSAVNCGVEHAAEWLQRALNVFNRNGSDFPDVHVDRLLGPQSLSALDTYLRRRGAQGETVLLRALNSLQGAYYILIGELNSKLEDYEFGWFANRIS